MKIPQVSAFAFALMVSSVTAAGNSSGTKVAVPAAENEAAQPVESDSDAWHMRGEFQTRHLLLGYEPALLVSRDGTEIYGGESVIGQRSEWRGRLLLGSRFFELQMSPYTNSSVESLAVLVGGLEIYALVPVTSFIRVGGYHHSAHNFYRPQFGRGYNMNAAVLELALQRFHFEFDGKPGHAIFKTYGHWYITNEGTPWVVTKEAHIMPVDAGITQWRTGVEFSMRHPWGKGECSGDMRSERILPASMRGECAVTIAIGRKMFGVWSEHLQTGPFVAGGYNFTRQHDFGTADYAIGWRVDLIAMDTTYDDHYAW